MYPIAVLILAILLRGIVSVRKHQEKHQEEFNFKYYFDLKHSFRWILHITSSIISFLVLPDLFNLIKLFYECDFNSFALLSAATVGFLGYDVLRFLEFITFYLADKSNIPLKKWVTKNKDK